MIGTEEQLKLIRNNIRSVPDYPKPGILFRDITSLVGNPDAYYYSVSLLANYYSKYRFTKIVGIEARGFLFSAPVALMLGVSFVPARKLGKLPCKTISENYVLEYGSGILEIHDDSIIYGDKVLIMDDILATGGTIEATVKLVRRLGGRVKDAAFVINLEDLGGKNILSNIDIKVFNLVNFSSF